MPYDTITALVEALAPDHVPHHARMVYLDGFTPGKDVQVLCPCGVKLTFLAAQIAAISPPSTTSTPKTKAVG
jgi:hypothetical protein